MTKKASANKKQQKQQQQDKKKSSSPSASPDPTVALSRLLGTLVSIVVVVAAILLKPLLEPTGFFATDSPIGNREDKSIVTDDVTTWPPPDPKVGFLVSRACLGLEKQAKAYCHPNLTVSRRHFRATERIEPGEILFEIPRSLQIWDLDALRDPWIRLHLFEASHRQSGNRLGTEAFLAVYLVLQHQRKQDAKATLDVLELAYYDVLPNYTQWLGVHPLLADKQHMRDLLGLSEGFGIHLAYRNMIISEFEAFSDFSKKFQEVIGQEEYIAARMNVLTRAIRVGVPGPEQAFDIPFLRGKFTPEQILHDELDSYNDMLAIDMLRDGCIALIPIADLFNHHPQNNVEYEFRTTELNKDGAFVIRADHRRIEKGFEPMVSYGNNIIDAHLFARYGFVNGDGTGPSQVSLAYYHDILRLNLSSQYDYLPSTGMTPRLLESMEHPVSQYQRFDDGYSECIAGPTTHPQEADLKLLKHKHILQIANMPERWQFLVPARNPFSFPGVTHDDLIAEVPAKPISFHTEQNLNMELPLSTCRLLSLTVNDLGGKATQVLIENLNNPQFILTEANESLEYRALMCIRRWMGAGLASLQQPNALRDHYEFVRHLNGGSEFGTRDWAAHHVRLGEMQSLSAVTAIVSQIVATRWGDAVPNTPEYHFREEPCPEEFLSFLFDETENSKYGTELL